MNKSESKYFHTAARMDEAFLALLEQKDFAYITVKELCAAAGVNRSTFYLHYETMGDLLSESVSYMNEQFLACMQADSSTFILVWAKEKDAMRRQSVILSSFSDSWPQQTRDSGPPLPRYLAVRRVLSYARTSARKTSPRTRPAAVSAPPGTPDCNGAPDCAVCLL